MKDSNRWIEFNSIIDDEILDVKEKGLILILFRYVNSKTGYANPSRALIKKLTKISDNRTLDKLFDSLIEKGYLFRESGNGTRSKYFIKVGGEIAPSGEITPGGEITPIVGGEITPIVGGEITPQKEKKRKIKENIYIDLKFIDDVIDKVKLTKEQYDKLLTKYHKELLHKEIIALDNYIANGKGNRYKDHYRVLNVWCNKNNKEVAKESKKISLDDY